MTPTNTAKAAPNCREDGHIYGWTRFWVPETGTINLSDGGFLLDPTDLVLRSHVSGPARPCHVVIGLAVSDLQP